MDLTLTKKQLRRLADLVYIGNWVLNSARGEDRLTDYDDLESVIFSAVKEEGMDVLSEISDGVTIPSRAFIEGGIHDAIAEYEDGMFFEILAEELARRDLITDGLSDDDAVLLTERMSNYIFEFEQNGVDNLRVNLSE